MAKCRGTAEEFVGKTQWHSRDTQDLVEGAHSAGFRREIPCLIATKPVYTNPLIGWLKRMSSEIETKTESVVTGIGRLDMWVCVNPHLGIATPRPATWQIMFVNFKMDHHPVTSATYSNCPIITSVLSRCMSNFMLFFLVLPDTQAYSANQGDNKVAGKGRNILNQNEVPKPGPQNSSFAVTHGACPHSIYIYIHICTYVYIHIYIYIINTNLTNLYKSDPHPRCGHPRCGQRHDERHAASLVCCSAVRPLENSNSAAASVGFHLARFETTTMNVSHLEFAYGKRVKYTRPSGHKCTFLCSSVNVIQPKMIVIHPKHATTRRRF